MACTAPSRITVTRSAIWRTSAQPVRDVDDGGVARGGLAHRLEHALRPCRRRAARSARRGSGSAGPARAPWPARSAARCGDADVLHPRRRAAPCSRRGRARRASIAGRRAAAWTASARFSATVMSGSSAGCWWTIASPSCCATSGVRPVDGLAGERDRALVGRDLAAGDAHQRRLAGAVLAEQRVHLARPQLERDVLERDDAREALPDAGQLEQRGHFGERRLDLRLGQVAGQERVTGQRRVAGDLVRLAGDRVLERPSAGPRSRRGPCRRSPSPPRTAPRCATSSSASRP